MLLTLDVRQTNIHDKTEAKNAYTTYGLCWKQLLLAKLIIMKRVLNVKRIVNF
jgi:hypothetical protein